MRLPHSGGHRALRYVLRRRSSDYDITRPTTKRGRWGGNDADTTTVSGVSMWVYDPMVTEVETDYGERLAGDMNGLALPTADIKKADRITEGSADYEVTEIRHIPNESDKQLKVFALDKRNSDAGADS